MPSTTTGVQNYKNLLLILIFFSTIIERLSLESIILPKVYISGGDIRHFVLSTLCILGMLLTGYSLQKFKVRCIWILNLCLFFYINSYIVCLSRRPFLRIVCWVIFMFYFMKLFSYHMEVHLEEQVPSFLQFVYFILIPKLIFTTKHKYKTTISVKNICKNILLMILLIYFFIFVFDNFLKFYLFSLIRCKSKLLFLHEFIRFSISLSICWITFFYGVFVCYFDILSDFLMYDDCLTHKDWWNSDSIAEFWRRWNILFHEWIKRYVYFPTLKRYNKTTATIICFTLSAIMHEYPISIGIGRLIGYPFISMLSQVFFMGKMNNYSFWLVFVFFGQPLTLLLCYRSIIGMGRNLMSQ